MQIAEIAPAAPALIEALPPLLILAGLLFALGCVLLIDGFVKALFGGVASLFSHIPGIGSVTASALRNAERAISSALGTAIHGIERNIGHQFHNLARVLSHGLHVLERSAMILWHLASIVGLLPSLGDIRSLIHDIHRAIKALERELHHTVTRVVHGVKVEVRSVAQGVYPRLRTLEHEVTKTIPRELKRTRALAREAEAEAAKAWNLVKSQPWVISSAAAIALVVAAIDSIGLGWIRCNNVGRVGRLLCGIPGGLLEDLAGLLADYLIVTNLCDLIGPLEQAYSEVAAPLVEAVTAATNASCGSALHQAPALAPPAPILPAVYFTGALDLP